VDCEDDEAHAGGMPEGEIQRRGEGTPAVTPGIAAAVGAIGAGGDPLPNGERRFFEGRFGYELSRVRVHADRPAAEAARALRAEAFTLGRDVAFAEGRYQPGSDTGRRLLAHELAHVIQQGAASPLSAGAPAPVTAAGGGARIARQVDESLEPAPTLASALAPAMAPAPASAAPAVTTAPGPTPAATAATGPAAGGGLIVEDDAGTLTSGQMRKSDFLEQLRVEACAAADRELARAGRDTNGCPHVVRLLSHYARRPAAHLERAIRKFVPGASATMTARAYIPLVAARMARGVRTWVETGRLPSDIPDEVRADMMAEGGVGAAIGAAIGGAVSSVVGAVGGALSAIGGLFFKEAASGSARPGADTTALSARLGPGRPLEGAARTRMEGAFGQTFGGVRLHDDARAAGLARDLGAHAFTLGEHVAFGQGNYRPGTPVGDALLAHELAHVAQQSGGGGIPTAIAADIPQADATAERQADQAAAGAIASLYAPALAPRPRPARLHTGLRLARCGSSAPKGAAAKPEKSEAAPTALTAEANRELFSPNPLDDRAKKIIAIARDPKVSMKDRSRAVLRAIINTYFPGDNRLIESIDHFDVGSEPEGCEDTVLCTTRVGAPPRPVKGTITIVGTRFLDESADEFSFARSVVRVRHELRHIHQYQNPNLIGSAHRHEREFLAFAAAAEEPELRGTGQMGADSRLTQLDGALDHYCKIDERARGPYKAQAARLRELRTKLLSRADNPQEHATPPECD
jgi:hypothetical protein